MPARQSGWPLPSAPRPEGRRALDRAPRLLLVSFPALVTAAGVATTANFAWPQGYSESQLLYEGRLDQFPPGTVKSLAAYPDSDGRPGLHIVRLRGGELLAFLANDPLSGCTVWYRADLVFGGRAGWFRDTCYGSTYDMVGRRVFGPSPHNLDRVAIEVRDGDVYVDPRAITRGGRGSPTLDGFQTGGVLLPSPFMNWGPTRLPR